MSTKGINISLDKEPKTEDGMVKSVELDEPEYKYGAEIWLG